MMHYTLVIRRYAPFESFGGGFEGDNRGFSTSMSVTSRTMGQVVFSPETNTSPTATGLSSGSSYLGPFAVRKGSASILRSVGEVRVSISNLRNDAAGMSFSVQTSGNIPLKDLMLAKSIVSKIDQANAWLRPSSPKPEGSPDIDTYVDFWVKKSSAALNVRGIMRGDSFPNAEMFLLDAEGRPFPLLDYRTSGGVAGPLRLIIGHRDKQRATFPDTSIPLQADGTFVKGLVRSPTVVKE